MTIGVNNFKHTQAAVETTHSSAEQVDGNSIAAGDGRTRETLLDQKKDAEHVFLNQDRSNDDAETVNNDLDTAPNKIPENRAHYIGGFLQGALLARSMHPKCADADASQMQLKYEENFDNNTNLVNENLGFRTGFKEALRVSTKESEQSTEILKSLLYKIDEATDQLNQNLARLQNETITPSESRARNLKETPQTFGNTFNYLKNRASGVFDAMVSTTGQLTAAVAIPTIASSMHASLGIQAASLGTGAYLGMSALKNFPELANNQAALKFVADHQKAVAPLFSQMKELLSQEKSRRIISQRIGLTALERQDKILQINHELAQIEKAIKQKKPSLEQGLSPETSTDDAKGATGVESKPVTMGDGKKRAETLSKLDSIRQGFSALFSSISEKFSNLIALLSKLPNIFERSSEAQQAANSEKNFKVAYKAPLTALARIDDTSTYNINSHIRVLRNKGIPIEKIEKIEGVREAEERQFRIGEKLTKIIKSSHGAAFGTVVVKDEFFNGSSNPDLYPVSANLTLARAMSTYFSVTASLPKKDSKNSVVRNSDGSLSIDDPEGKLYNFLLAVPSAYTATMAGSSLSAANARLTIDDPNKSFPGGAISMQFENALKLGENGVPLRDDKDKFITELKVTFLKNQPQPIFIPLVNERKVLEKTRTASIATEQEAEEAKNLGETRKNAVDYSGWDLESLRQRLNELVDQLEQEGALLWIDADRMVSLEYWKHPEASRFR